MQIYLVPLQIDDHDIIDDLSYEIGNVLNIPTSIYAKNFSFNDAWDPMRNQVDSTWILSKLLQRAPNDSSKILGVTNYDLYIPVFSYVIGEAELNGRSAVVSTYRLKDEHYGLQSNRKQFKKRLVKESLHELGHTFGLIHCFKQGCVMQPITHVGEIDVKTNSYCNNCYNTIKSNII